jgi:PLP dependent protein
VSDARDEYVARVRSNLEVVHDRVAAAGRDPATITIVAVTKTFGPLAAAAARDVGLRDVGENYASELVATHDALGESPLAWHYLGAIQSNKLARLAPRVAVYQSVSSRTQATAIARRAPGARCYVQVDLSGQATRGGCAPSSLVDVLDAARGAGLSVEGLMCVATADLTAASEEFRRVRRLADDHDLAGCSMGMSNDLEVACRAGSTMLRLGAALFGERASTGPAVVA